MNPTPLVWHEHVWTVTQCDGYRHLACPCGTAYIQATPAPSGPPPP
jgi:hypothetical protein